MPKMATEDRPFVSPECRLPDVSQMGRRRRVYVDGLGPAAHEGLARRGYEAIELMSMPRTTEADQLAYLRAKLQAFEERTVEASEEDRKRLELEARAWGMLGTRQRRVNVNVEASSEDIDKLLDWDPTRHTLSGNTTAVFAQAPEIEKPEEPS
jgi:hypothetical protein